MTTKEILETVKYLAKSQGFYTRLYEFLNEGSEDSINYLNILANKNFKDPVDLILYFEE